MQLEKLLIGLGIFTLFVVGGMGLMFGSNGQDGVFDTYNVQASNAMFQNLSKEIDGVYNITTQLDTDVTSQEITKEESWQDMVIGGYTALKTYLKTFGLVGKIITSISISLGVPVEFAYFGALFFFITVIFTVIYMLFRFQPR